MLSSENDKLMNGTLSPKDPKTTAEPSGAVTKNRPKGSKGPKVQKKNGTKPTREQVPAFFLGGGMQSRRPGLGSVVDAARGRRGAAAGAAARQGCETEAAQGEAAETQGPYEGVR